MPSSGFIPICTEQVRAAKCFDRMTCSSPLQWASGAVGSAREWHSRGHRFDPGLVHHPSVALRASFGWQATPSTRRSRTNTNRNGLVPVVGFRRRPAASCTRGALDVGGAWDEGCGAAAGAGAPLPLWTIKRDRNAFRRHDGHHPNATLSDEGCRLVTPARPPYFFLKCSSTCFLMLL